MTIWLLAVILLASLAGIGYRQGAIRVAFSCVGILIGLLLAGPLSGILVPVLKILGVKGPILQWILPPLVIFCLVSIIFKVAALAVHKKVEVHFKYKAGDLRLALFERLNARLGLCLGLVNGTLYLILVSFVIYIFSYWTIQVADSPESSWRVRLLNRVGKDLDRTGLVKTGAAAAPMPESYYKAADIAGLVYQNPLLEARLSRYPAFLILGEGPPFQALGADEAFANLRLQQAPLAQVLDNASAKSIVDDPELLREIWATVEPNLDDLGEYLETGISTKFEGERIYGRWRFNPSASAAALRKERPNISSREMQRVRQWMQLVFANTGVVAGTENRLVVKNLPRLAMADDNQAPVDGQAVAGGWQAQDGEYVLSFEMAGTRKTLPAVVTGERLSVSGEAYPLVFDREI